MPQGSGLPHFDLEVAQCVYLQLAQASRRLLLGSGIVGPGSCQHQSQQHVCAGPTQNCDATVLQLHLWSSGYDVSLTRGRSPVRSWPGVFPYRPWSKLVCKPPVYFTWCYDSWIFRRRTEIGIAGRPHAAGPPDRSQKAPGGGAVLVRPHNGCSVARIRRRRRSIMTAVGFEPAPLRIGVGSQPVSPLGQIVLPAHSESNTCL